MHVGSDDDLLCSLEHVFAHFKKLRNDADDMAAVLANRRRQRAHQSVGAAAIDKTDLVVREDLPEFLRRLDEGGIGSGAGTAIDANPSDGSIRFGFLDHEGMWHCCSASVKDRASWAPFSQIS